MSFKLSFCGTYNMCSLVGKKKKMQKKTYKRQIIEAFLEFGSHFGNSNFCFLNGVESTK